MKSGTCRYCGSVGKLLKSHAIPNAYFRNIKKNDSGSLTILSSDDSKARKAIDSGADHLLCENCEASFNEKYDKPLIRLINDIGNHPILNFGKFKIDADSNTVASAIMSWFWRASISKSTIYDGYSLESAVENFFREAITNHSALFDNFSFKLDKLFNDQDANHETWGKLIVTPRVYRTSNGTEVSKKNGIASILIVGGVCIMMVYPKFSKYKVRRLNYIYPAGTELIIENTRYLSVPFVQNFLMKAIIKERK